MSIDNMKKSLEAIAKKVSDSEKIPTDLLALKMAKYISAYPYDQTLGTMSQVIEKMASNQRKFITKSELKDLYSKLYVKNTKFAELFSDELGIQKKADAEVAVKQEKELNIYDGLDPILSNALNHVFDRSIPLKTYSQKVADKALKSVASTLDIWELSPTSMNVVAGNENFLVVQADYETPKGLTSVYIPLETVDNTISSADVFIGNGGIEKLNNLNVKKYIISNAGQKLKFAGTIVLASLIKSADKKEKLNDVELAVAKLNVSKQAQSDFFTGQILGQKVAEYKEDVKLPISPEVESFEKQFSTPQGVANFDFGKEKVNIAREVIARDLISFGYKNYQLTITGSNKTSVLFGVSLDGGKVAFTVPVKIAETVIKPSLLIVNGSVSSFDKKSINELYVKNQTDYKVAAAASPLFGLRAGELVETIKKAVAEGNHAAAEDALNVLQNTGDDKAYALGFETLMSSLTTKTAETKTTCSFVIKTATSQHPVCGHTNLPLHKVYQDKHGNCHPLYRKNMDENYEAVSFNAHKVLG